MEQRVGLDLRTAAFSGVMMMMLSATPALAQTTVVLDAPDSEVADTTIQGGSYARTNLDTGLLITRESDDDPSRIRLALLKFDTETRIRRAARISSAVLTLTVKTANASSRRVAAYRVTQSFDERAATWSRRKSSARWRANGADLGRRYAETTVSGADGVKVSFDITSLVQATVKGSFGSRYTRVALVDVGGSGEEVASYREYYSSEADDPSLRPRLTVVYGGDPPKGRTPDKGRPNDTDEQEAEDEDDEDDQQEDDEAETPAPKPPSSNSPTLRVLQWNTAHGRGTDGDYDIERIASWIAKMNPDVVSLNEVERYVGSYGNEDQPARFAAMLREKTGVRWYHHFAQRYGNWRARGQGNAILSRHPIDATASAALPCDRSAALATIVVKGRPISVVSTHLANDSAGCRGAQVSELLSWVKGFPGLRIIAGDWNATQQRSEYSRMLDDHHDAWAAAARANKDVDMPNNTRPGATHKFRIDYVFYSQTSALALSKAQVYDTRGPDGARASDHKPLLVTFSVK
jgi:endonuclease/exonuclease/phosphatase family metal-dependent hydrolase